MTSKILFVLLISCALAFASPIQKADETDGEVFQGIAGIIQSLFGKLLEKIGEAIHTSLQKAFHEISARLDTDEYKEAITELQIILKKVYGDHEEPNVEEEDEKVIEQELEKIAVVFEELIKAALKNISEDNPDKVDATEFKEAVENLKKVVDKIFAEQGTN